MLWPQKTLLAFFFLTFGFALILSCSKKIEYPVTRTADVVDNYHGTAVGDPYRWLEDDNAEETLDWVNAQNEVTFAYLEKLPGRKKIEERLTELWNYEKYGLPYKEGGLYFFSKNDGLQNQSVLYVQKTLDDEPRELLDPNTFSADGTIALTSTAVSKNGRYLMYGLSSGGSDWQEFRVRDIDSGEDMPDILRWIKFSGASWSKDSGGFYYSRFPESEEGEEMMQQNKNMKIYYHRLGDTQDKDLLIHQDPQHPDWGFYGQVTDDGNYLIITVSEGTDRRNRVYFMRIGGSSKKGRLVKLLDDFDAGYGFIGNDGPTFYFQTDLEAPKGRVIAININRPRRANWREIIPEGNDVIASVSLIHEKFVVVTMHDAHNQIKIYNKNGPFDRDIQLPALGAIEGISGKKGEAELFFGFLSFAYPHTIFRYDFSGDEPTVFRAPEVKFNPDDFETKQVFYPSADGTEIPMFLTYKKGMTFDGDAPVFLYGYGGFNISLTPRFSVSNLLWMELGGIYAQVNLRGGGEYGIEWYQQGILEKKQNVFDDFIAAAEYLIAENYTSSEKLAIGGASNGGLLVGACMTQRPDLYAVALPAVGVLDMLRYHHWTIGWAWASDYGRSDNPEHFDFLYKYSPLHNLKKGTAYPATLITTADHDDRVVPAHSFKFAAALQQAHAGAEPVLIRIETRAGHGAGKPTSKQIEEQADKWAFVAKHLRMKL